MKFGVQGLGRHRECPERRKERLLEVRAPLLLELVDGRARAHDLWFRVESLGFSVWSLGFGFRVLGVGYDHGLGLVRVRHQQPEEWGV